jgi:L-asparaginase
VKLLVTGGTFDKEYDEISGRLYFKETHVAEMLRLGRSAAPIDIETLMMIDSLEMTDSDRAAIVAKCESSEDHQIVVTHGTDTMEHTARALGDAKIVGKTIVLTGAMVPYKFGSSDGLFNLGSAIAFAQTLPNGVYVAMNGRWFNWKTVRKNKATGEFYEEKK